MVFRVPLILLLIVSSISVFGQIPCPPNLPFTLVGNTSYCVGTSGAQLNIPESYAGYEWLPTPETTQSILLTAGNYEVVVTHYTGCTDTLAFVVDQVSNPPQPVITLDGPDEFCEGESVVLTATTGYPFYSWSSGSVSENITVFESGIYLVSITDELGCQSSSNSIAITVNPLPVAAFSPNLNSYDVSFNNLSQNATDYEWNFGDGNVSIDFEPIHTYAIADSGNQSMWLVASNGCGNDTAFLDLSGVNIEETEELTSLQIFPNPTNGTFSILVSANTSKNVSINMFDALGRLAHNQTWNLYAGENTIRLNTDAVLNGIYLLELKTGNSIVTERVVVQR